MLVNGSQVLHREIGYMATQELKDDNEDHENHYGLDVCVSSIFTC